MSGQSESVPDLPLIPEEILSDYRQAYRSQRHRRLHPEFARDDGPFGG